jgi:shikimate dehydrogenase
VADVIPKPPRTALIRDAQARGCIVLDGLGRLVDRAAIAIAHWTGRQASASTLRAAIEALVGGGNRVRAIARTAGPRSRREC